MVQPLKALVTNPGNQSLIPGTRNVEGENKLPQVASDLPAHML